MENILTWKSKFEAYHQEAPSSDGSHDINHFKRVWKLAESFASPQEDKLVILAACYFHDIVSYPKNDPRRSQSSVDAAQKANSILSGMGFPTDKLEGVKHCIEAHSFSANIQTQSVEAEIVQDADRMEALGAIGLARTFYVAGLMGSKLFSEEDPFAENREYDDKKYAIDHFEAKLFKLPGMMKTAAGQAEASKRARILQQYLADLRLELDA
jgi:uncharacterized protein